MICAIFFSYEYLSDDDDVYLDSIHLQQAKKLSSICKKQTSQKKHKKWKYKKGTNSDTDI
jgi:hypothetical protein